MASAITDVHKAPLTRFCNQHVHKVPLPGKVLQQKTLDLARMPMLGMKDQRDKRAEEEAQLRNVFDEDVQQSVSCSVRATLSKVI